MSKTIIITVRGGVADCDKSQLPPGYDVEIHDYDVPDDFDDAMVDADGDRYQRLTWGTEPDETTTRGMSTARLVESCRLLAALPEENFHGCGVGAAIRAAREALALESEPDETRAHDQAPACTLCDNLTISMGEHDGIAYWRCACCGLEIQEEAKEVAS